MKQAARGIESGRARPSRARAASRRKQKEGDPEALVKAERHLASQMASIVVDIASHFDGGDAEAARDSVIRLRYYVNAHANVRERQEE